MHAAANRLFIALLTISILLQAARPHIENPTTAALVTYAVSSTTKSSQPEGFLQDSSLNISYSPLFSLIVRVAYHFGDYGLVFVHSALLIALFTILFFFAYPPTRHQVRLSSIPILSITAFFIGGLSDWQLTPQITALIFTSATAQFLLTHRRQADWLCFWPLFLIQTAWNYTNDWFWIGLLLILTFSIEIIIRESIQLGRWSILAIQNWFPVVLISFFTLFLSPPTWKLSFHLFSSLLSGQYTLYPLETLTNPWSSTPLFAFSAILLILLTLLNALLHYGQICWTFAIFSLCLGWNTLSSDTYTLLFLNFTILTLISSLHFSSRISGLSHAHTNALSLVCKLLSATLLSLVLNSNFSGSHNNSLSLSWQHHRENLTLTPHASIKWLARHAPQAKILHHPDLFPYLLLEGIPPSNLTLTPITQSYSPSTRRKAFLLHTRPQSLIFFINQYHPDYVIVDLPRYSWIPQLRQLEYRPVHITHNASVWTRLPDHPTQPMAYLFHDYPHSTSHFHLELQLLRALTLASAQHPELAWDIIKNTPAKHHTSPLFIQALLAFSFHTTSISPELHSDIQEWVQTLPKQTQLPWHAQYLFRKTKYTEALSTLRSTHFQSPTLTSKSLLALDRPTEALATLQHQPTAPPNPTLLHLSARAHHALNNKNEAAIAYQQALIYAPDDRHLKAEIQEFLKKYNHPSLRETFQNTNHSPLSHPTNNTSS
ncbi:MAG: hypothetical protein NZM04_02825 [Methylacidiphilales bacterium]|nr:hypothetical protein [Candidatus Methylacidiphilales bacterium]MDW8348666.1 hypothetical protein [Verrucomicrobiae bacterium]